MPDAEREQSPRSHPLHERGVQSASTPARATRLVEDGERARAEPQTLVKQTELVVAEPHSEQVVAHVLRRQTDALLQHQVRVLELQSALETLISYS